MAFSEDQSVWDAFLAEWPLERLRTMALDEYTRAGDKHCFTYWLESALDEYGSIWGGSAFKFGIYSRNDTAPKAGDSSRAYDDGYGWYRQFGSTAEEAFAAVREEVVRIAEAARRGAFAVVDQSRLGPSYSWKIAFHYQDRSAEHPIPCVFQRKPLLHFCGHALNDRAIPLSDLYQQAARKRETGESVIGFSRRLWREWVTSTPLRITLTEGAVRNGYLPINLVSAPFPESVQGGDTEVDAGEPVRFRTDTGLAFESDVRAPNGYSGRLRKRLGSYFKERQVKPGDVIEIRSDDDDGFTITHLPKGTAPAADPPAAVAAPTAVRDERLEYRRMPVNKILCGPPGTGKTYHTVNEALEILDPEFKEEHLHDRAALKARYDELAAEQRIRFVTFQQSFSYEDFVEGIRADSEGGQLQYRVEPGVFRAICEDARGSARVASDVGVREGARIWKISIDGAGSASPTREYCFANGEARIGWPDVGDLANERLEELPAYASLGSNDRSTLKAFSREIEPGDVLLCIRSEDEIQAVGVVQGEYEYQPKPPAGVRQDFPNVLPVKWLATGLGLDIRPINDGRKFTVKTVYEITRFGWPDLAEYLEAAGVRLAGAVSLQEARELPYVLIIDEINRGNVSRIFGELITLIEPSKRRGAEEALEVVLPYSRKRFSVPRNVHLIGTMNTADRSLAGLDVALRRRFEFVEMLPDSSALLEARVDGIALDALLDSMNRRIEVLLGRDYMLGHAYFMPLVASPTLDGLAGVFRKQVLPLLQEYFFEDWQKIAWVLNDHRKPEGLKFVQHVNVGIGELLGDVEIPGEGRVWSINDDAFELADAYLATIKAPQGPA